MKWLKSEVLKKMIWEGWFHNGQQYIPASKVSSIRPRLGMPPPARMRSASRAAEAMMHWKCREPFPLPRPT